jgi:hypothetical protein
MNPYALHNYEIPVAVSMLQLASRTSEDIPNFMCLWVSFNNIYTTLWEKCRNHQRPTHLSGVDPSCPLKTSLTLTETIPREHNLIEHAFAHLSDQGRHDLAVHPNVAFFAHRTPRYQSRLVHTDSAGKRLNGVLNVGYSRPNHPVWSPLDMQVYQRYQGNHVDSGARDQLANQLVYIVYTVRNNIFHGGKRADDADDMEVVQKALPLLKILVQDFYADSSF